MTKPAVVPEAEARARILGAAERLFAEKGYAATAVHEITDAAGVNRALLYYYFEDKHSLYKTVLEEGTAEFDRMLDRSLSHDGTHAERLSRVVHGHLSLIWDRPYMARLVHRCLLDGLQKEFGLLEKFSTCVGRMETFFREGMEAGAFRRVDPQIMARTFLGPTFVVALWRLSEGEIFPREQIADQIAAMLLRGIASD